MIEGFVDWPFPFGPVRSHYNQFAQASQVVHASLRFGNASSGTASSMSTSTW